MGDLIKFKNNQFKIEAKTETVAEINIYGAIGASWYEDSISASDFSNKLKELPASITQLDVHINSIGGDVFDGVTIYNRLKMHKANVTVYIDALSASIASVIMMAGDEIVMGEGALVMIHKPATGIYGNSLELQAIIDRLDDVETQMTNIYQKRTKMDRTELKALIAGEENGETWLDADRAVELGFADRKMSDEEDFKAVACSVDGASWIVNKTIVNQKISETQAVQNKITEALAGLEDFVDKEK